MKIAHVMRRLSFADWGGTEQVVCNLAKVQAAAGQEVRLFATTALCPVGSENAGGLEIRRFPAVYPWWPMTKKLSAALDHKGGNPFVPGLGRALREWKPDVVHCHAMGRNADALDVPAMIGVGGSFNFVSGRVKRAPVWVQRCGLEWVHRICQEPGRLWCRYALGLVKYPWVSLLQLCGRYGR